MSGSACDGNALQADPPYAQHIAQVLQGGIIHLNDDLCVEPLSAPRLE
jgi:hypothetical protein